MQFSLFFKKQRHKLFKNLVMQTPTSRWPRYDFTLKFDPPIANQNRKGREKSSGLIHNFLELFIQIFVNNS